MGLNLKVNAMDLLRGWRVWRLAYDGKFEKARPNNVERL